MRENCIASCIQMTFLFIFQLLMCIYKVSIQIDFEFAYRIHRLKNNLKRNTHTHTPNGFAIDKPERILYTSQHIEIFSMK